MSAVPVAADDAGSPPRATRWPAHLQLEYLTQGNRTVVASKHAGPLRVLKPLYPERGAEKGAEKSAEEGADACAHSGALCQSIVVHPPGGIAVGDALAIDVHVPAGAQAQVTTPGAAKWYKANGRSATQDIQLRVAGAFEWLPQEAIVFDAADVASTLTLRVSATARLLGWDIVALGRTAAGESFASGRFRQTIRLTEDAPSGPRLHWLERTHLAGGDALLHSPIGLGGAPVFGCLWAWGPLWTEATLESLRAQLASEAAPLTVLAPQLLVARTRGATTQQVRATLEATWRALRPLVLGRAALTPRIWAT